MSKKNFRNMLKRSLLLEKEEIEIFDKIPEEIIENIFKHNFDGNINTAERVLFNRYGKLQQIETEKLERFKLKIHNLTKATETIANAIKEDRPVLFLTDTDNDGSLSQAVLIEFMKLIPQDKKKLFHIEYAQAIGKSHGFTYEIMDKFAEANNWSNDKSFLIVTADNGINNRSEQEAILSKWKNADLIITDHHLPNETVVLENDRTIIFNPKYQPNEYFQTSKNISGANTLGVLLTQVFHSIAPVKRPKYDKAWNTAIENIREIGYWANLLDYAGSSLADMPTKPYVIERALKLRPLLNVSTSMSNFITTKYSDQDLLDCEIATQGNIKKEWLKDKLDEIAVLNVFAQRLLSLYNKKKDFDANYVPPEEPEILEEESLDGEEDEEKLVSRPFTGNDFFEKLAIEIGMDSSELDHDTSINNNYIEQLRPIVFNLAAIDEKDSFETKIADYMSQIFQSLRQKEKEIMEEMRKFPLYIAQREENSDILQPISPATGKIFKRKLLNKAYNEDNKGFRLILNDLDLNVVKGSMRSLYRIQDILSGKEELEKRLGMKMMFMGHDKAAGFQIEMTDPNKIVDQKVLSEINKWISKKVGILKGLDPIKQLPIIELDFTSVGLINKINAAVKSNLAGMIGVPAILRFSPDVNHEVWITDNKTTKQINLKDVVNNKKYGYQPIATDLHGGAFIAPVELLRTIVDSNFEKALNLQYMDDGVFIGQQVEDMNTLSNVVEVKGSKREEADLIKYYKENFSESNFIDLQREDFKNLPYFKFNKYSEKEFDAWENVIIAMLDKTNSGMLAVVDTEGTGLGKAPKCFNIGSTNIVIDDKSGEIIKEEVIKESYFKTSNGYDVILTDAQKESLLEIPFNEDPDDLNEKKATILYKNSLDGISSECFIYPGYYKELNIVKNMKELENGEFVINRKVKGSASSFLIKGKDFAITKDFENLTGISQNMLNEIGISPAEVDKRLVEYYSGLKNADGSNMKIIFQAHNMPYDKGVVSSNFGNFNKLMEKHIISDTAKIARANKLAYDNTPVSSFVNVDGIPAKVYFYDSPYSEYSLSTFLAMTQKGKGGVFPDTTENYLLRYTPETNLFSIIDRKKADEFILEVDYNDLWDNVDDGGRRVSGDLPNNAVKYSVERLSSRTMIRNIMLNEDLKVKRLQFKPNEKPFANLLRFFQDNYHFDSTIHENLNNFQKAIEQTSRADLNELFTLVPMVDFAERFLQENKKIQAKFHDSWIYEKVLKFYEPTVKDIVIPKDVVEQVNYLTDIPSSKIKDILKDIVNFEKAYGLETVMVHEQHNNIRQRSENGLGLSDTAYEIVLPQFLALMKNYNPYYHNVEVAAKKLIHLNMKGAMIQTALKNNNDKHIARDSYSNKQMVSFDREEKTELIQRAEQAMNPEFFNHDTAEEKFKLGTDVLPIQSAIYAKPKRHLSQEEIYDLSEKLSFIVINEQVKQTAISLSKLSDSESEKILNIVKANDEKSLKYKEELLSAFYSVEFSRRESDFAKIADMYKSFVEKGTITIPARMKLNDTMIEAARFLADELSNVLYVVTEDPLLKDQLQEVLKEIEDHYKAQIEKEKEKVEKDKAKAEKARKKLEKEMEKMGAGIEKIVITNKETGESVELSPEVLNKKESISVRDDLFLPELDITRRNPLAYLLKNGIDFCVPYLRSVLKACDERIELENAIPKSLNSLNKKM